MKIKFCFTVLLLFIVFNISCVVSLADTAQAYLYDSDGVTCAYITVPDSVPGGVDAYFAVYSQNGVLQDLYCKYNVSSSVSCELLSFKKGNNMRVVAYLWDDEISPVFMSRTLTYPNTFVNGSIMFEAENIACSSSSISNDYAASGGKTVKFISHRWYPEQITSDDMYADIYVNENETDIMCNIWMRCYTNSIETASVYQDLNTGTYFAKFFSSKTDKTYRWTKSTVYLGAGMNHIAFRYRCPSVFDKFIITSNLSYIPEGLGTLPDNVSEDEYENEWKNLWQEPEIKPTAGHPRLYVTADSLDKLREKLTSDDTSWRYDKFRSYSKEKLNCTLDTTLSNNHNSLLLVKIMSRALCWVLGDETDKTHAQQTIDYMKEYLRTVRTPDDTGDITRVRGDIMVAASIVYDWCYSELTDEDKIYFINQFKKIAASKEIGWPPVNLSSVASHGGEQEIFRDLLSAGVAIYDEYPLMYNLAAGRLFEEMLPARMWLRQAGRFDIGNDYAECRFYSEVWADAIFQAMGYDSIYGDIKGKNLRWLIYSRLPYGSMMPSGDMYTLTRTNPDYYDPNYLLTMSIAADLYNDPVLKQEMHRRLNMGYYGEDIQFFYSIFNNPDAKPTVWDSLPLSNVTKYPVSGAVARTSWQEGYGAKTAVGFMNMHEIFVGDHQNVYTGDFQLYYKGLLAMNTGTYNASTQHNEGYKRRAIAGNTMLCYDPDESFVASWSNVTVPNDGGQRLPYLKEDGSSKSAYVMKFADYQVNSEGVSENDDLTVARNVNTYTGPNRQTPAFTYVGGELTNAYSDKVNFYRRDMVFMDLFNDDIPAAFVVYDRMESSDASFKKTWLLHSQEKPVTTDNSITVKRTEGQFNGKLYNKVLLPENPLITTVGGDNNEMFNVGGITLTPKANTVEGGKYRIELSPSVQNKEDVFLNAMYMTDADSDYSLDMTKFETDKFIGVKLADRLVLFNKTDNSVKDFALDLSSFSGTTYVLITGLSEGNYKIGNKVFASENSCISLTLATGKHNFTYTSSAATSNSYPRRTKENIGDFFVWLTKQGAARGYGNYIYIAKPTIYRDGIAYISKETLTELGATVTVNGTDVTAALGDKTYTSAGFSENSTLYINPKEFADLLGCSFNYNKLANVLNVIVQ